MTVAHYDSLAVNADVLLDLPFREGTGITTDDLAKPHHPIGLVNTPTWTALASGLGTLNLDGSTEYLQCNGANCVDLDFTSDTYAIWGWLNWTIDESSQIVIGRYEVSVSGWELYLTEAAGIHYLTLRHHHAAGATVRTGAYSVGWTPGTDWFFGVVRVGANVAMTRNGVLLTTVGDAMIDPETCAQDLVIGVRYTKDANYFKGMMYRPRVAAGAVVTAQFAQIYEREAVWF